MADQPDIASLAFQRHLLPSPPLPPNPNALFFFLILFHSSFHCPESFKSEQTQLRVLTCLLEMKAGCFCCCCCCLVRCYANLAGATCGKWSDSHFSKSSYYFSKVYFRQEFNGCLSFSKDPSSPAEIKFCVSCETPPTPPKKLTKQISNFVQPSKEEGGS